MATNRIHTADVITSETVEVEYAAMLLDPLILKGLTDGRFYNPTPVQLKAIPPGRAGSDLFVQSKAGTGKTLVFTIIALSRLKKGSAALQSLCMAPTREIVLQSCSVIRTVGKYIAGLRCHGFIGGVPMKEDVAKLRECQIAVGTPGRVKALLEASKLHTEHISLLVLDEADTLMSGEMKLAMNFIIASLSAHKQTIVLSATYSASAQQLLMSLLRTPVVVSTTAPGESESTDGPALQTPKPDGDGPTHRGLVGVEEFTHIINPTGEKLNAAEATERKQAALLHILRTTPFHQCIVFCNAAGLGDVLAKGLVDCGFPAAYTRGGLSQKERGDVVKRFATLRTRILVSTDLTARGVDMSHVNLVVSMDVPFEDDTYMHRIGRTGRYGTLGVAVAVLTKAEERHLTKLRSRIALTTPLKDLAERDASSNAHMVGVMAGEREAGVERAWQAKQAEGTATNAAAAFVAPPPAPPAAAKGKGKTKPTKRVREAAESRPEPQVDARGARPDATEDLSAEGVDGLHRRLCAYYDDHYRRWYSEQLEARCGAGSRRTADHGCAGDAGIASMAAPYNNPFLSAQGSAVSSAATSQAPCLPTPTEITAPSAPGLRVINFFAAHRTAS